jgi:hypothetical protein
MRWTGYTFHDVLQTLMWVLVLEDTVVFQLLAAADVWFDSTHQAQRCTRCSNA